VAKGIFAYTLKYNCHLLRLRVIAFTVIRGSLKPLRRHANPNNLLRWAAQATPNTTVFAGECTVIFAWRSNAWPSSIFGPPNLNGIRLLVTGGSPVKTIAPQVEHPTTVLKIAPQTIPHGGACVFRMVAR
jgi:hypothetical protein